MTDNDPDIRVTIRNSAEITREEVITIVTFILDSYSDYEDGDEDDSQRNENVSIETTETQEWNTDKTCSVCLEKFKAGEKVATILCAHTFHKSCIEEWSKYKQECPLCRKSIPNKVAL